MKNGNNNRHDHHDRRLAWRAIMHGDAERIADGGIEQVYEPILVVGLDKFSGIGMQNNSKWTDESRRRADILT